ncbi:MAG: hypothetical protein R3D29_13390 [Nitratireductor sp.]
MTVRTTNHEGKFAGSVIQCILHDFGKTALVSSLPVSSIAIIRAEAEMDLRSALLSPGNASMLRSRDLANSRMSIPDTPNWRRSWLHDPHSAPAPGFGAGFHSPDGANYQTHGFSGVVARVNSCPASAMPA